MILFWAPPLPVQPASCMLSEWKYFYSAAFDRKFFENQQPQRHKQLGTFECAILFSCDPFLGRTNIFQDKTRCSGAAAAAGRRNYALNLERVWANQRRADLLSRVQGRALLRRGMFRRDWSSQMIIKTHNFNTETSRQVCSLSLDPFPQMWYLYFPTSIH